jgi:hypothetical protein
MQAEIEFIVDTECGRHFCWSAPDYEGLINSLHYRGYKPTFIMPYEEYLLQMEDAKLHIERELKESA